MSDFLPMMLDMLPVHSALQKSDNPLRVVLDRSLGEYMDSVDSETVFDGLFLQSASGGWLDAHGRDYGVSRKLGESDEDYRNRIVFEKLEYLTASNLQSIYDLTLYAYVSMFDATENTLTSDNPYVSSRFMSIADDELQSILNNKFVLNNAISWINNNRISYAINTNGEDILNKYIDLFSKGYLGNYFKDNTALEKVSLYLPKAYNVDDMFTGCSGLTDLELDIPNIIGIFSLCKNCTSLVNLKLNAPNLSVFLDNCKTCTNLDTVELIIDSRGVNLIKEMFLELDLSSLVINGVEYID